MKLTGEGEMLRDIQSLPTWERGLKLIDIGGAAELVRSLPTWERGLKRIEIAVFLLNHRRSPRGSVD